MIFAPIMMNMIQFWVQDNFLKAKVATDARPEDAIGIDKENPAEPSDKRDDKGDVREINNFPINAPPYTGPEIDVKL